MVSAEGKIKAKDLSYESNLPPFLQRLHDQQAGRTGDPDRHERQIARPTRAKTGDEDDGPTMVDESGDNVSKEEYEKLTKVTGDEDGGGNVKGRVDGDGESQAFGAIQAGNGGVRQVAQKVNDATVGGKKRKVAKVVGEEDEAATTSKDADSEPATGKVVKKVKKKAKPIKLAFDDEGD